MQSQRLFLKQLIPLFLIGFISVFSQGTDLKSEDPIDPAVDRKAERIAKEYERVINAAVSGYFEPKNFVVDARVVLEEMLVPIREHRKGLGSEGLEELPGLPVVPDEMKPGQGRDTLEVVDYRKDFGVKFVDVKVFVDTSLKAQDVDFLMELVSARAKLDQIRGDRIQIVRKPFPKKTFEDFASTASNDTVFVPGVGAVSAQQYDSLGRSQENWTHSFLKNSSILFPLLILCLFILLLAWMIFRFLKNLQKDKDSTLLELKALRDQINQINSPVITHSTETLNLSSPESSPSGPQFKELRASVIDAVVGRPQVCAKVLASWMNADVENGHKNSATLIFATDIKLYELIRPYLNPTDAQKLQWRLNNIDAEEAPRQLEVLLAFKKETNLLNSSPSDRDGDIFNFLTQMNFAQLAHLLKDESAGIRGLALAQVPSDKAAELLQRMDDADRADTLVSMGQIQNVSIDSYKQVALRLSQKALDVTNMRFVSADGVESIIDVIASLPVANQKAYLDGVAEMDLTLAQKIRRFYVPMEMLPRIEAKLLADILSDLDREQFALSLAGLPQEYTQSLLNVLPERMQQMVQSGMQSLTDYSREDQEKARKKLLAHVRSELKKRGGAPL